MRRTEHLHGLGVPFDALDALELRDGTLTGSSYTEASPRPGVSVPRDPLSQLVPVVSGAQAEDLELVTLATGSPGTELEGCCEVGWRFADETDAQVRGWCAPNWLTGWTAAVWSDSTSYPRVLMCTHPTQQVIVNYAAALAVGRVTVWDPRDRTWSTPILVGEGTIYTDDDFMVCLPSGRLIAKSGTSVYRSDDVGTTWTLHAERVDLSGVLAGDRARAAVSGDSVLVLTSNSATGVLQQFASDDQVASLSAVETTAASFGYQVCVAGLPQGGFLVAYRRDSDSAFVCRVLASAWTPLSGADVVVIDGSAVSDLTICVDPDGVAWAHWTRTGSRSIVRVAVSVDGGATWTTLDQSALALSASHTDYLTNLESTAACGSVYLAHNWTATTGNEDGSVGVAILGGWSTVTPADVRWTERLGSGEVSAAGACWLPIELPHQTGLWSATGSGGAELVSPGEMQVGDGTVDDYYFEAALGTEKRKVLAWGWRPGATGGALSSDDCCVNVRLADGSSEFEITVRLGPTGVRLRDDVAGTTLETLLETVSGPKDFVLRLREPGGTTYDYDALWWKDPADTEWTRVWTGGLTADTGSPAANGRVRWGHVASSDTVSYWTYFVQVADDDSALVGEAVGDTRGYSARGRPIGVLPVPLAPETGPEADAFEIGGGPAWLSVAAGPGALSEVFDVAAEPDYAIEHLWCSRSPSPSETWRATGTDEVLIALDDVNRTWRGDAWCLVARAATFRTAHLEAYQGGAWVSLGELDLATGFDGLAYDREGTVLVPATGTAVGGRALQEGELAGATAILDGTKARRIAWNTAGTWGASGSQQVRVLLDPDTLDGTEPASGTCALVAHSGVLVVPTATTLTTARRWRVRVPAGQLTVDDRYEAGALEPWTLRGVTGCDWGWSRQRDRNVIQRRSRAGTVRVRREGAPARAVTLGWAQSATDLTAWRSGAPDYLSAGASTLPLASAEDVQLFLEGFVELLDLGAVPVLFLASVPATVQTVTDPSLWLVGHLEGSPRADHVVGTEGAAEVWRPAAITIREVV